MAKASIRIAVRKHDVVAVKFLLDHGAKVNALYYSLRTLLHQAVLKPHVDVIKLLLEHGANVNASDLDGQTPLHYAVVKAHVENVRLLLEHGANVNAIDYQGKTPLRRAVLKPNADIIQLLLKHGAYIHACDDFEKIPLCPRIVEDYSNDIKRLWSPGTGDIPSIPLHYIVKFPHVEAVKLLLDYKVHVNDLNNINKAQLHRMLQEPHLYLVKILLEHGSNVNEWDIYYRAPLHCFVLEPHADIVRLLIKHGADLHTIDLSFQTPLHYAVLSLHVKMVKLLLNLGANVNAYDEARLTPLHHAMLKPHSEMVKLLLEHGADVNAVDSLRRTPLHYFLISDKPDISVLYTLMKYGANVNAVDRRGMHVLSAAVRYLTTPYEIAKLFLENGAIPKNKANILLDISLPEGYFLSKLLIQYIILKISLSHATFEILDKFKSFLLAQFAEESENYKLFLRIAHLCINEIKIMKNDFIGEQTLFQFVTNDCFKAIACVQNVALHDIYVLVVLLKSGKYVECRDLIYAALKRSIAIDRLFELEFCFQTDESVNLNLNYDCIDNLAKYMSNNDVINLCIVLCNEFSAYKCHCRGPSKRSAEENEKNVCKKLRN